MIVSIGVIAVIGVIAWVALELIDPDFDELDFL